MGGRKQWQDVMNAVRELAQADAQLADARRQLNLEHLAKGKKGTVFGGVSEVGVTIDDLLAREAKL